MNSTPFSAERQASVAISRIRAGSCSRSLLRQWRSASIVRSIAASLSRPVVRQPLAQPDDAGKAVEHAEAVLVRPGDQQAAVVGAEVERRIERPARPARRRLGPRGSASPRAAAAAARSIRLRLSTRLRDGALRRRGGGPIGIGHSLDLRPARSPGIAPAPAAVCSVSRARLRAPPGERNARGRCALAIAGMPVAMRGPRRLRARRRRPLPRPLGNSSTVELRTLTPSILVRIQVPQPIPTSGHPLPHDLASIVDIMIEAAIAAAAVICEVYERPHVATAKADGSPVTEADARAEDVILEHLAVDRHSRCSPRKASAAGRIPVLGERFFVVDPLDGTKEFLKRNGEFTVNIALCEDGRPVAGVVLVPPTGALYWGFAGGAFEADGHGRRRRSERVRSRWTAPNPTRSSPAARTGMRRSRP